MVRMGAFRWKWCFPEFYVVASEVWVVEPIELSCDLC